MKHTRKMVMIPEVEYQALLRLMSKGITDPLQGEKTALDAKIISTLSDPKIEPEIKQKKYNLLYKQRRKIKDIIENKPQKVIVENISQTADNIPPYLGITKQTPIIAESDTAETESTYTTPIISEEETPKTSRVITPRINSEQHKLLLKYVSRNLKDFGLEIDGRIRSFRKLPIKNSDYRKALDYMVGKTGTIPPGLMFFLNALKKDNYTAKILKGTQFGKGKRRVLVKKGVIKTPGLKRITKFKPQLWVKL